MTNPSNDQNILSAFKNHLHQNLLDYYLQQKQNAVIQFLQEESIKNLSSFLCNILHIQQEETAEISLVQIKQIIESPITFVSLIGSVGVAKEIYGEQLPQLLLMSKRVLELDLQAKKMETLLLLFNDTNTNPIQSNKLVKDIPKPETQHYFSALLQLLKQMQDRELVTNTIRVMQDIRQNTRRIRNLGSRQVWAIHRTALILQELNSMSCLYNENQFNEILFLFSENIDWFYRSSETEND